jgi:hypothetical protein
MKETCTPGIRFRVVPTFRFFRSSIPSLNPKGKEDSMRYVLIGLFAGALAGLLLPQPVSGGVTCNDVTNTHYSEGTCCTGCGSTKDFNVDTLKNNHSTQGNTLCIVMLNDVNVNNVNYWPQQCEFHDAGVAIDYTIASGRQSLCTIPSYDTDVARGNVCGWTHAHNENEFENCCP